MVYLDCSVKSCTYNNEDGCCCKGDIQVEGREATEAQSTCCGSFKDRGTNGAACNALKMFLRKSTLRVRQHTAVSMKMRNVTQIISVFPVPEPAPVERQSAQASSATVNMNN